MPSDKPARRIQDIIDNIDRIQSYTSGYSLERFLEDRQCQDAVERCISRISEAAKKLEGIVELLAPDEPWSDIRGVGNMLRHEYDRIDRMMIWDIVRSDLDSLRVAMVTALEQIRSDKPETQ